MQSLILLSIILCCAGAIVAQNSFILPEDIQQPVLRYHAYHGGLLLGDERNTSEVSSVTIPSTWEDVDTLAWASLYVPEETALQLMSFGESGRITYLDGGILREAERLGDEIIPAEEEPSMLLELPNKTPFTCLISSRDQDSFLLAGIAAEQGFLYDIKSEKWGSIPFNSELYRVFVSQSVVVGGKQYILFASDMPGGYGGLDVYRTEVTIVSRKRGRGRTLRFGPPVNLGGHVNTAGDDFDPSYEEDVDALYFLRGVKDGGFELVVRAGFGW